MATVKEYKHHKSNHRKTSRQGAGSGTKTGRKKGSLKPYRGQGGPRKAIKH